MDIYSIYRITNLINNKIYIGFTSKEPEKRYDQHFRDAKRNSKNVLLVQKAISKYGLENFNFEVIYQSHDMSHCLEMESFFIKTYSSNVNLHGYNVHPGGTANSYRVKQSEETKRKASIRNRGEGNPFYNKKHSPETRLKMSKKHYNCSGAKNPRAKGIILNGIYYACVKDGAEALNLNPSTLRDKLNYHQDKLINLGIYQWEVC